MSTQEDRQLAGRQVFVRVVLDDVKRADVAARAELESRIAADEGVAAELPDGTRIGTVKRSKVKQSAVVTDPAALLAWVKKNRPEEIVESVNPAFVRWVQDSAKKNGEPITPNGEVIPGVEVIAGSPSYLPQVDPAAVPVIRARLAELLGNGLLALPEAS